MNQANKYGEVILALKRFSIREYPLSKSLEIAG